jgi:hypothetical protein
MYKIFVTFVVVIILMATTLSVSADRNDYNNSRHGEYRSHGSSSHRDYNRCYLDSSRKMSRSEAALGWGILGTAIVGQVIEANRPVVVVPPQPVYVPQTVIIEQPAAPRGHYEYQKRIVTAYHDVHIPPVIEYYIDEGQRRSRIVKEGYIARDVPYQKKVTEKVWVEEF